MQDLLFASKQILLSGNDAPISMAQINEKHLKCLEHVYVLVSNLVFSKDEFVRQFYDCSIKLQMASTFRLLLRLTRHNARIVMDVLTVLLRVIKEVPQSFNLTENIIFCQTRNGMYVLIFRGYYLNVGKIILITIVKILVKLPFLFI